MTVRVAVIYYSATGSVHRLAEAVAGGARTAGADVRLRRVAELAPPEAISANPRWAAHAEATRHIPLATNEDLDWADAIVWGTPTRFGNVTSQLKQFIDGTGGLWSAGKLSGKVVSAVTSASNRHGGNESTLLALYNSMYHWGAIIVPPGYTDATVFAGGGNPYGTSHPAVDGALPDQTVLEAARYQGARTAGVAARLRGDARPATVTPHIVVRDVDRAARWYAEALGAREESRVPLPGGKVMTVEMRFGDSEVMMADEFPDQGIVSPLALGGTYGALQVATDDVDTLWKRALEAGATVFHPLADVFWGERYGQIIDPFGHRWGLAQHVRDVPYEEIVREAASAFGA